MSAKLYALRPADENNSRLRMSRRLTILARPDVQAQIADLDSLLTAHHVSRLLTKTDDLPCDRRGKAR